MASNMPCPSTGAPACTSDCSAVHEVEDRALLLDAARTVPPVYDTGRWWDATGQDVTDTVQQLIGLGHLTAAGQITDIGEGWLTGVYEL